MYLQDLRQPWAHYAFLLLLILYTPAGFSAALSSTVQIDYKSLSKRVEQIENRDAYQLEVEELARKIETLEQDIEDYIATNPNDVDAIVLLVRLSFVNETVVKNRRTTNEQYINPKEKFRDQHELLDRAIELRPDNAKAHYWKARLYGLHVPVIDNQGNSKKQSIDLERAIHFAEQAVLLDKRNQGYREALAVYHFTAGNRKAALEVMDTQEMASSPVSVLLKDLDGFPVPEGTVYAKEDSEIYSELHLEQKTISDFPYLRSQVFMVPMTATQLEKFYQKTWPEFRFFRQVQSGLFAQYLIFGNEGLRPTRNVSEARAWAQSKLGGIALSVTNVDNPSAAEREKTPGGHRLPASLGEKFSYVFYLNDRIVQ
jgi:tetratricopeptide (TPR) repeat protein